MSLSLCLWFWWVCASVVHTLLHILRSCCWNYIHKVYEESEREKKDSSYRFKTLKNNDENGECLFSLMHSVRLCYGYICICCLISVWTEWKYNDIKWMICCNVPRNENAFICLSLLSHSHCIKNLCIFVFVCFLVAVFLSFITFRLSIFKWTVHFSCCRIKYIWDAHVPMCRYRLRTNAVWIYIPAMHQ